MCTNLVWSDLVVPDFPLRLNNEFVLDRLTADEVKRCCQVGVLRPQSPRISLIDAEVAVSIGRQGACERIDAEPGSL